MSEGEKRVPVRDSALRRYRMLVLRRPKLELGPLTLTPFDTYSVWGTEAEVGVWATFEGEVLRKRYGLRWPDVLQSELWKTDLLLVEGEDNHGKWHRLPTREPVKRAGRPLGSGIGMLVRHMRDVEGVRDYDELLSVLVNSRLGGIRKVLATGLVGEEKVKSDRIAQLRRAYQRGAKPHAGECRYCRDGLPKPLNDALMTFIRTRSR